MAQNWTNKDGLFIQFGSDQTTVETAGEFALPGYPDRIVEYTLDLTTLSTSSATVLSNNLIFPSPPAGQMVVTKTEIFVETAATSGGSATLNLGLIQHDRATVPSNYGTAFANAVTVASMNAVGLTVSIIAGGTFGTTTLLGSQPANATGPYFLTAQAGTAVFTAGKIRVRVTYRGIGVITQ